MRWGLLFVALTAGCGSGPPSALSARGSLTQKSVVVVNHSHWPFRLVQAAIEWDDRWDQSRGDPLGERIELKTWARLPTDNHYIQYFFRFEIADLDLERHCEVGMEGSWYFRSDARRRGSLELHVSTPRSFKDSPELRIVNRGATDTAKRREEPHAQPRTNSSPDR